MFESGKPSKNEKNYELPDGECSIKNYELPDGSIQAELTSMEAASGVHEMTYHAIQK